MAKRTNLFRKKILKGGVKSHFYGIWASRKLIPDAGIRHSRKVVTRDNAAFRRLQRVYFPAPIVNLRKSYIEPL